MLIHCRAMKSDSNQDADCANAARAAGVAASGHADQLAPVKH